MEIKHFTLHDVKADETARTIEGWASTFNNVDQGKDIVMPGAFAKTLKGTKSLPMLWQHRTDQVIGVWNEFEETDKGLRVKGRISETTLGNDAYTLTRDGAVSKMSIGYGTKKYEIDQTKGVRKLIEVDLYEVSLVTFPMNDKAAITRVKSDDGAFMTERDFEEFLRDEGGLSWKEAKIVVSDGYKALLKHRDGAEEVDTQQAADAQRLAALINRFRV